MRRRSTFARACLLVWLAAEPAAASAQSPPAASGARPNVVLIMMDDMGYGDLGSYGGKDARTPNIDRLARQGVRLTQAYANGATCTPTRAALMTGRYPQRVGLLGPLTIPDMEQGLGLRVTGKSLPALLKANGYATALVGKWHLGGEPQNGPNAHGFDSFFGFLSGAVDYYRHRRRDGKPDLYENTTPVSSSKYLTDELTERAVGFIDRGTASPFFLEVSYNAPHWPFQPPDRPPSEKEEKEGIELYQMPAMDGAPTRQDYVRILERADSGVGAILAALDRRGLSRNTLVIFTNDNGGEWLSRNAPLFHRKGTLWEGGIRVPLLVRWPGHLPAGKVSKQLAITMDLTASVLSATHTAIPPGHALDGIDLLPALRTGSVNTDRVLFWSTPAPRMSVAAREGRWKLLVDGPNSLLFDMESDPGERQEVGLQHPAVLRRLSRLAEAWFKETQPREATAHLRHPVLEGVPSR